MNISNTEPQKVHKIQMWNDLKNILNKSSINILINEKNEYGNILEKMGVNENSALGQIIIKTAGIIVENTIRVYANGNDLDMRNIYHFNLELEQYLGNQRLVIADDIFGGLFALNKEAFQSTKEEIWYFAPDTLEWENLEINYKEFIDWISRNSLNEFYSAFKWSDYYKDVKDIKFNQGILVYPFLWSNECNIETAEKKIVPFSELITLNLEYKEKFNR